MITACATCLPIAVKEFGDAGAEVQSSLVPSICELCHTVGEIFDVDAVGAYAWEG